MASLTPRPRTPAAGLCATCRHRSWIQTARGTRYMLCGLAAADARYRRYPELPVLRCDGYRAAGEDPGAGNEPDHRL